MTLSNERLALIKVINKKIAPVPKTTVELILNGIEAGITELSAKVTPNEIKIATKESSPISEITCLTK